MIKVQTTMKMAATTKTAARKADLILREAKMKTAEMTSDFKTF
jgi:hypothetical protein